MSGPTAVAVDLVVALGLLVVVPLGLRLLRGMGFAARWWPLVGAAGAASLWLPRGPVAVALASAYGVAAVALALAGLLRAARWWRAPAGRRTSGPQEVAVLVALAGPAVAASALVAERAGVALFGFGSAILALTVPHLLFAGFAAALVAGLVSRRVAGDAEVAEPAGRAWADAAALTVPVGTLLVLAGYFVGDWAELVGAVVLTGGMWVVGWLTWTRVRPSGAVGSGAPSRGARAVPVLLAVSAAVLAVTMVLALAWAVGEATGWPHPTVGWMVATHGVANAVGFALCGLLAWRLVGEEAL